MATKILDNSETYLRIFVDPVEIDYTLPKYKVVLEKEDRKEKEKGNPPVRVYSNLEEENPSYNGYEKRQALLKTKSDRFIDKEFFDNLTADGLTLIIDEERASGIYRKFVSMMDTDQGTHFLDSNDFMVPQEVTNVISGRMNAETKVLNSALEDYNSEKNTTWWGKFFKKKKKPITKILEEKKEKIEDEPKKPTFEMDVIKFFESVKLVTDQETVDYYNRISPYLVALKRAKEMGQSALVDGWMSRIFIAKYESLLRVKGFHHKITESQMVQFVKKTEKGVTLTYIKNFAHPIPDDVAKRKLEADSLHVFDNYVILHYDPKGHSYAKTQKEKEDERIKRADPIMFGIIWESRDLYYIADWIDSYCDLTLDKFLEVSGFDKKTLEIGEKIQL